MRRRHALALLVALLPALATLSCGGGGENTNNFNASANTSANVSVNTSANVSANTNANVGSANHNAKERGTPSSRIDEIKAKMPVGHIAFTPPPSVRLDESKTVTLLLSPKQTGEELEGTIRNRNFTGPVEKHSIKVSDRMKAVLTGGDDFYVLQLSQEVQEVSRTGQTRWDWQVRPRRTGTLNLHLVLNAIVDVGGGAGEREVPVETFHKEYVVEVPTPATPVPARPADTSGGVWPWLLVPALLVPAGGVAAWLWLRGRGKRRAAARWLGEGAGGPKIFLSYRRDDTAGHAGRLRDALAAHFGPERIFMDLESIGVGEDFVEAVERAVGSAGVVVVVMGRQWLTVTNKQGGRRLDDPKDFVRLEVETALRRGVKVIPALVQEAEMPGEDALPEPLAKLARRNAIEISDARWAFDVQRLAAAIEAALATAGAGPEAEPSVPT